MKKQIILSLSMLAFLSLSSVHANPTTIEVNNSAPVAEHVTPPVEAVTPANATPKATEVNPVAEAVTPVNAEPATTPAQELKSPEAPVVEAAPKAAEENKKTVVKKKNKKNKKKIKKTKKAKNSR